MNTTKYDMISNKKQGYLTSRVGGLFKKAAVTLAEGGKAGKYSDDNHEIAKGRFQKKNSRKLH